jgi:hypothetical protein
MAEPSKTEPWRRGLRPLHRGPPMVLRQGWDKKILKRNNNSNYSCLKCEPTRDPRISPRIRFNVGETYMDEDVNSSFLDLSPLTYSPRVEDEGRSTYPNIAQGAPAALITPKNTTFRLLLGGYVADLQLTLYDNIANPYIQARLEHAAQLELINCGQPITPLELAVPVHDGRDNVWMPLKLYYVRPSTLLLGERCHKFILPVRITRYRFWSRPMSHLFQLPDYGEKDDNSGKTRMPQQQKSMNGREDHNNKHGDINGDWRGGNDAETMRRAWQKQQEDWREEDRRRLTEQATWPNLHFSVEQGAANYSNY